MKKIFGFFASKHSVGFRNKKLVKTILLSGLVVLLVVLGVVFSNMANKTSLNALSKTINTYDISLNYKGNYEFEGSQVLHYKNRTNTTLENIKFNLYATAFSENATHKPVSSLNIQSAYPNGSSYGTYNITKVKIGGKAVGYTYEGQDKNVLVATFDDPLEMNRKAQVEISFNLKLPNINHRYGYGANAINMANFYPVLAVYENNGFLCDPYNYNGDPFYTDMSNYNVELTVPTSYKVAHSGYETSKKTNGTNTTYKLEAKVVRDFAFVMSEKFSVVEGSAGKTNVKYYYYNDPNFESSLKAGIDSINTFSSLFGNYPYPTYSVVQTNFVHGGMEYPNLSYISDSITKHSDYINVIIHETAHQWWYQMVGSNAYRNPWQDEGLTEFATLMFYEKNSNYNINATEIIASATNSYVSFIELCESVLGSVDTSMNRHLHEYDTEPEYVYVTYVKGMIMFSDLRELVGNANFERALKNYFNEFAYKNAKPSDLIKTFETTSLRSLQTFFNSYIQGKVVIKTFG